MKLLFSVFFAFLLSVTVAQNWQSAAGYGGNNMDKAYYLQKDHYGHKYLLSQFKTNTTYDTVSFASYGGTDVLLSQFGPTGNLVWTLHLGGPDNDKLSAMSCGQNGKVYIAGEFTGSAYHIGNATISGTGPHSGFIARIDSLGNVDYANIICLSSGSFNPLGLAVNNSGDLFLSGNFQGTMVLETDTFRTLINQSSDFFIARFSEAGAAYQWLKQGEGANYDCAYRVVADDNGDCYFSATYYTGPLFFNGDTLPAGSDNQALLVKMDVNGNTLWKKSLAGNGRDELVHLALDGQGNLYAEGWVNSYSTIPDTSLPNNSGSNFILKYKPNGQLIWAKPLVFSYLGRILGMDIDTNGNCFVAGFLGGTANFDGYLISSTSTFDLFLAKINGSGYSEWATTGGTNISDTTGNSLVVDEGGNCWLTGSFSTSCTFGTTTLNSAGNSDLFLARAHLACSLPPVNISASGPLSFCQGSSVILTAPAGYAYYLWNTGSSVPQISCSSSDTISLTVATDPGCIGISLPQYIQVNNPPNAVVTFSGNTGICQGDSLMLHVSPGSGYTYQWFRNTIAISGAGSANYAAKITGSYSVSVTNNGCTSVSLNPVSVAVTAPAGPLISPAGPLSLCDSATIDLQCTPASGYTYVWYKNGLVIPGAVSPVYSASSTGSFTVRITTNGCGNSSAAVLINAGTTPPASISLTGDSILCEGDTLWLNANAGNGLTYQWYLNGMPVNGAVSMTFPVVVSGSYSLRVGNSDNCYAISLPVSATVNALPPAPVINVSGSLLTSSPALTYQWYFNQVLIPNAVSQTYNASQGGTYTVVITDSTSCTNSGTVQIVVTAMQVLSSKELLIFYPNPASGSIHIDLPWTGPGSVMHILNSEGMLIKEFEIPAGDAQFTFSAGMFSDGLYLALLKTKNNIIYKGKFLITRPSIH